MRRRLMAAILAFLGREPRHGNGAYSFGRRSTDNAVRERRLLGARVDEVERRLASYNHVRFPR